MTKVAHSPQVRKRTRFARPLGGGVHHMQLGPSLTDQGDTFRLTVGVGPGGGSTDYGYRAPGHPNGAIGQLQPSEVSGQVVWILVARELGNLVIAKFGGQTGVQIEGEDTLYVRFGELPEVELSWNAGAERYEGVSLLVRLYLENLSQSLGSTFSKFRW